MASPTPAIENELQMLEDADRRARKRGLEQLSTLGPAALARQAHAVVARLEDSDCAALCIVREALTLVKLLQEWKERQAEAELSPRALSTSTAGGTTDSGGGPPAVPSALAACETAGLSHAASFFFPPPAGKSHGKSHSV